MFQKLKISELKGFCSDFQDLQETLQEVDLICLLIIFSIPNKSNCNSSTFNKGKGTIE